MYPHCRSCVCSPTLFTVFVYVSLFGRGEIMFHIAGVIIILIIQPIYHSELYQHLNYMRYLLPICNRDLPEKVTRHGGY